MQKISEIQMQIKNLNSEVRYKQSEIERLKSYQPYGSSSTLKFTELSFVESPDKK